MNSHTVLPITLLKFNATDNVERKENDRQFIEGLKRRMKFEKTLFYRFVGKPYNKVTRFVIRQINKLATFMLAVSWKIERKIKI